MTFTTTTLIKAFNPNYIKVKAFNRSTAMRYHLKATILPYLYITLTVLALTVLSSI